MPTNDRPRTSRDGKHGPLGAVLTIEEQKKFVDLLKVGNTRTTSCESLKINYKTFTRTFKRYKGFRQEVRYAEQVRSDNLYTIIYLDAIESSNVKSCAWVIEFHERMKQLGRARREAATARREAKELTERAIDKIDVIDQSTVERAGELLKAFREIAFREIAGVPTGPPKPVTQPDPS